LLKKRITSFFSQPSPSIEILQPSTIVKEALFDLQSLKPAGAAEDDDQEKSQERTKRRRRAPVTYKNELEMDYDQLRLLQQAVENSRTENLNVDVQPGEGENIK
jgi:hypothetical protein